MSNDGNPVEKAIRESAAQVAIAKAATRKRNLWAYIRADELTKWARARGLVGDGDQLARKYFENTIKDPDAPPVVEGTDPMGNKLYAVYVGIAWKLLCPDGACRFTTEFVDLEMANQVLAKRDKTCDVIDMDAEIQTPCPGGAHKLEKLARPIVEPTF